MRNSPKVKVIKITFERHIPLTEKVCSQCGTQFMGVKIQRYCTTVCAKKASYWRNPDAYRKSRMKSYRKQKAQET